MNYRSKLRMSIGWVYPIGILSTYVLFVMVNWRSLYSHERFELNSRRLFRLAAERIFETSDGFTERPFAGGKIDAGREELLGFTRFLHGSYIIRPFYLEKHIALAFSMNKSLMVTADPGEVSQVRIDWKHGSLPNSNQQNNHP